MTVGTDDFIVVDATAGIVISEGTVACAWTIFYYLSSLSRHLMNTILSSVVKIRKLFYFGLKFSVKKCIQKQHLMLKFFDKVLQ